MIAPLAKDTGPEPNSDMPEAVLALYDEARAVAQQSPRSAAALLRLALEGLLRDLYPGKRLNDAIGEAVQDGLSRQVQQAMDVLRFNGNEAVHELRLDDQPQTTHALFGLLNLVVEQLISQPKHIDALYQAIPHEKREQIDRRNQRMTSPQRASEQSNSRSGPEPEASGHN